MADETVDPNYKLFYNLGYATSHFKNTSDFQKILIEKASKTEADALRDGKKEYHRGAYRRQADSMTARSPEQEAALVKEWQKQARSAPGHGPTSPDDPEPPSPAAPAQAGYQMTEKEKREYQQFEKEQEDRSRRQPYKEGTKRIEKAAEESGNYADAAIEKHIQDDKQKNADLHEKHTLEAQEEAKRGKKAPEKDKDDGRGR